MREIVSVGIGDSPPQASMEGSSHDDVDDVVGCLPSVLCTSHRVEIEAIAGGVRNITSENFEGLYERFQKLLDLYHEQANLLDPIVPGLLNTFLESIHLPSGPSDAARLDDRSTFAMKFLYYLTKIRGYKVVVRILPHEVTFLERLLSCLEKYDEPVGHDLQERSILLYWLWIVCKNPFDLRRFDPIDKPGSTMERIFKVAMPYFDMTHSIAHYAAALVVAQCLARADGQPAVGKVVEECMKRIDVEREEHTLGSIILLNAILKHVDRRVLVPCVTSIVDALSPVVTKSTQNTMIRKCVIKAVQRVALVLLKPKMAKWRYQRGKRRLEDNLLSGPTPILDDQSEKRKKTEKENSPCADVEMSDQGIGSEEESDSEGEQLEDDFPHYVIEWSLDCVLKALADVDTPVRWSAAKGVGRVAARLPRELASQVVTTILHSNFHRAAGHASWHGGCMALAELSRRGLLLAEQLPEAFPIVNKALFYQEQLGRLGLGRNVRDAACYVFWTWARAYEPREIRQYIDTAATNLICAALFDREVSIRRAASAAFQENVGRQGSFPNGIDLLTVVDFFAVGRRAHCYETLCVEVAQYDKYANAMVDHLIEDKVLHWDVEIRKQAAVALQKLAIKRTTYVEKTMKEKLVPQLLDPNPVRRHGILYAVSHCVHGLIEAGVKWDQELICALSVVPGLLRPENRKSKVEGGDLTRMALSEYIHLLTDCRIPLPETQVSEWLAILEETCCDGTPNVREHAAATASKFIPVYLAEHPELMDSAQSRYVNLIGNTTIDHQRIGGCALSAAVPAQLVTDQLFNQLCTIVIKRTPLDEKWAFPRAAAVKALGVLHTPSQRVDRDAAAFSTLFIAMDDYTEDKRGDIGCYVRSEAMKSLTRIITEERFVDERKVFVVPMVQKFIQQSAEKIGRVRRHACEAIVSLLQCAHIEVPHSEKLSQIYLDPTLFLHDFIFPTLSPLFSLDVYYHSILHGLVISAGGVSDVTMVRATQPILDYITSIQDDKEALNALISGLWQMLSDNEKIVRVTSPVLSVLPVVFMRMKHLQQNPDQNPDLSHMVTFCLKILNAVRATPTRIRIAMSAVAPLLHSDHSSKTWNRAASVLTRALRSQYPMVRRNAAETLYETLCLEAEFDEELLLLLAETPWQETQENDTLKEAAIEISRRIVGAEA